MVARVAPAMRTGCTDGRGAQACVEEARLYPDDIKCMFKGAIARMQATIPPGAANQTILVEIDQLLDSIGSVYEFYLSQRML